MSAYLLGAGFKADMGTQSRKLVLLKLIDACDDDGSRIFPAVATVARAAQCSTRQVQREIKSFLEIGLLRLVRAGGAGPKSTNEYALDLDALFAIARDGWDAFAATAGVIVEAEIEENKGDTMSPLENKGDIDDALRVTSETSKGDNRSHTTPPYPSSYPSRERDGARELRKQDQKAMEDRFWELVRDWPDTRGMPKDKWLREWLALSDEERDRAERRRDGWLAQLKAQRKSNIPVPSTYFREKLFDDIADPVTEPERPSVCKPFSKGWSGLALATLLGPLSQTMPALPRAKQDLVQLGGPEAREIIRIHRRNYGWPKVNTMHERARSGAPAVVPPEIMRASERFRSLQVGSPALAAWQRLHEARGWPFPDMGKAEWICFPPAEGETDADIAAALETFRQAIIEGRANDDAA